MHFEADDKDLQKSVSGNALIRTLQFDESNKEDKIKPIEETIRNFFKMITTNIQQPELPCET